MWNTKANEIQMEHSPNLNPTVKRYPSHGREGERWNISVYQGAALRMESRLRKYSFGVIRMNHPSHPELTIPRNISAKYPRSIGFRWRREIDCSTNTFCRLHRTFSNHRPLVVSEKFSAASELSCKAMNHVLRLHRCRLLSFYRFFPSVSSWFI